MSSFRLKLVLYLLLIGLVPVVTAFYSFDALAKRSATQRVDVRLQAGLRSSIAAYAQRLDAAERLALSLSRSHSLQRALLEGDRVSLERMAANWEATIVGKGLVVNDRDLFAASRSASVVSAGRVIGKIVVRVPLNETLLLRIRSGLDPRDRLVVVRNGRIVAGSHRGERLLLVSGDPARVSVAGRTYRGLAAVVAQAPAGVELATLARQGEIDGVIARSRQRIVLALLGSLVLLGLVAHLAGRVIVRRLGNLVEGANAIAEGRLEQRVDDSGRDEFAQVAAAFNRMATQLEQRLLELQTERRRARKATVRFGEALAATHDLDPLLRVIVETAVEAAGAYGGFVAGRHGELARAGDPDSGTARLELPLTADDDGFGQIVLTGPGFDDEQRARAESLVAQAAVALENARLHRIVERQALVDTLTGLANRRALEETLRAELERAERFKGGLCLVLADLDGFKAANDQHGHPSGDIVLREFAQAMREIVRSIDVAGRWGGDEFALILPGTDVQGGAALADRVRAAIAARDIRSTEGDPIHITASFGVAAYPLSPDVERLVSDADDALYEAKRAGRDRVATAGQPSRR